jgi:hypothetical protein
VHCWWPYPQYYGTANGHILLACRPVSSIFKNYVDKSNICVSLRQIWHTRCWWCNQSCLRAPPFFFSGKIHFGISPQLEHRGPTRLKFFLTATLVLLTSL